MLWSDRVLTASFLPRLRRGLLTVGLVLGVVRCAPEYHFRDDDSEGGRGSSPLHCSNKLQDGDLGELGIDCGGPCPACACADGTRECDQDPTTVCETVVATDVNNCGTCRNACDLPNAVASCISGQCVAAVCQEPFANCNAVAEDGCEVDLSSDAAHCGKCNERCIAIHGTPSCEESRCRIECDQGWDDCNESLADGCETPTQRDTFNCGGCATVCKPKRGETAYCKDGECGSTLCDEGLGDCDGDGECTEELATDLENCGRCGRPCVVVNGTPICEEGECVIDDCDPGYRNCDTDSEDGGYSTGCEANILESLEHCGGCNQPCEIDNATARCVEGECIVATCTPPFADCDGDGKSCETDTSTDPTSCGGCMGAGGVNCAAVFGVNNANGACVDGQCKFDGCHPGFADCNEDRIACEIDVTRDPLNCGDCGRKCLTPEGTLANECENATCQPMCAEGFRNCNGDGADGCESNVRRDPENCGACGNTCETAGAVRTTCEAGKCVPTCNADSGDCDGNGANGCETDITTDPEHCGGCDLECELPTGTTRNVCEGGTCVPTCKAGEYDDCDGNGHNGCETALQDNDAHCGACGKKCQSGEGTNAESNVCEGTTCKPVCLPGWGACENPELGCTVPLDTPENCGECGKKCGGATPHCVAGTCQARIALLNEVDGGVHNEGNVSLPLPLMAGSNRLLLIAVVGRSTKGVTAYLEQARPDSVRLGDLAARPYAELDGGPGPSNSSGQGHVFYYYLLEDDLDGLGTGTRNVQVSATSPQVSRPLIVNALMFSGVNQASPFGGSKHRVIDTTCQTTQPSDTVTVPIAGSVIYSAVTAHHTSPAYSAVSPLVRTLEYAYTLDSRDMVVQGGHLGVSSLLDAGNHRVGWTYEWCSNSTMLSVVIQPHQAK